MTPLTRALLDVALALAALGLFWVLWVMVPG